MFIFIVAHGELFRHLSWYWEQKLQFKIELYAPTPSNNFQYELKVHNPNNPHDIMGVRVLDVGVNNTGGLVLGGMGSYVYSKFLKQNNINYTVKIIKKD